MLWWIGAVLALVCSVAWTLYISSAVSRGDEWARTIKGLAPAYGFHFVSGMLGLWLMINAVG